MHGTLQTIEDVDAISSNIISKKSTLAGIYSKLKRSRSGITAEEAKDALSQ